MPIENWRGPEISAKARAAAQRGIDKTTAMCVMHAKTHHPWNNVTGALEGSLQLRPAVTIAAKTAGRWGSFTIDYALWQEIGTTNMPARPYLRPAADACYPFLRQNVRESWELL